MIKRALRWVGVLPPLEERYVPVSEKWEYAVYRLNSVGESLPAILNEWGEKGWELAGVSPQPPTLNLIFKRRPSP